MHKSILTSILKPSTCLLGLVLVASLVRADDSFLDTGIVNAVDPDTKTPVSVQIFGRTQVNNETKVVRYFFTYTCPFGSKYDHDMAVWGASLPANIRFIRVPIITNEPNSMVGAVAYYAAYQTNRLRIDEFQSRAYTLIRDENRDPSDPRTYIDAARLAKLDVATFHKMAISPKTQLLVKNAVILGQKYKVVSIPTLTVGGLYTLTPEPLAESKTSFIEFANAIASKYINENRTAIQ